MNGADVLVQALQAQGVHWISTLCGHGLNEIYAACQRADLRLIDVRNEQTAAYMAESWGRLSRHVGVCAVSSGVAHANALSGVVNAHFDGAPMLLISGSGPLETAGKGHFQDFDQVGLAASICKYAQVIDNAQRIPELVVRAFKEAISGRPGPVHLTFPIDIQEEKVTGLEPLKPVLIDRKMGADHAAIATAVDWLEMAERPLIVAGSGAYYAYAEQALQDFVRAYGIPVVVPIWDRGVVGGGEEYMGVIGAASGSPALMETADLVLALGTEPDYRVGYLEAPSLATGGRVIRIEDESIRLNAGGKVDLVIRADVASALEQLQEECVRRHVSGFETWLRWAKEQHTVFLQSILQRPSNSKMHALDIMEVLQEIRTEAMVFVVDGGNIGQWFHQTLGAINYPGHYLSCGASGVVGFGLGGAMAACAGFPQRSVILLSGDGSATFTLAELECAVRQNLPFIMIIADDESWGVTASGHLKRYGRTMSSDLGPIDFAQVACGFGAMGVRVADKAELKTMLNRGLTLKIPMVIHVPITGGLPGESVQA